MRFLTPAFALLLATNLVAGDLAVADPADEVRSYRQMADLYRARGNREGALVAARSAVSLAVRHLGEEDPRTADALVTLAEVQAEGGDDDGAAESYRQAVTSRREYFLEKGWTPGGRARQADVLRSYMAVLTRLGRVDEVPALEARARDHERAAEAAFREGLREELARGKGPAGPTSPRRRYRISVFVNGREWSEYEENRDMRFGR